ncbi:GNAT superfamily N-acetyltransferase [Psychromicrobium silvestre]|uniref:GNAT superfamily N-acetyltransferase n=1 Tax=Psychromicrobium silvestre TaxID=1645614 RepID=A0A7Y9LW30_9MICC|nr:GNAT family N-acetyltransferase [Psychromicrobium silvestre]NYE96631.1 GNAT superfamily N-acetyltransferase [Psychromicrobium silvestre]
MALEYRPWLEGDDRELLQIWGDPEGEQVSWFRQTLEPSNDGGVQPDGSRRNWKRCIVATDQGIPVAAGMVMEQGLHSSALWIYVEVARDHRRHGVAATLLTMLRHEAEQAPSGVRAVTTKVDEGTSGAAFVQALGWQVIQTSRFVQVDPGVLALPRFPKQSDQADEDAGSELVQDLATGSVELTDVVGRWYESVHRDWSPTGPLSPGAVQSFFLADSSGAQGAIVLRAEPESAFGAEVQPIKKGRVRAFAVSYGPHPAAAPSEDPPADVFLGWEPELEPEDAADAVHDLVALVAYQHPVVLEVDSSMQPLTALVDPLIEAGQARQLGATTIIVAD